MRVAFSNYQQGENKYSDNRNCLSYAADYFKERNVRIAKMAVVVKLGPVDMRTMNSAGSCGVDVQVYAAGLH